MKKILLALFAIASVSAIAAEGINVYGRVGLDIYSHYNKGSVKKSGREDIDDSKSSIKSKGKVAPNIAIEVTKDLNPNFELGLGIGYVWHGKRDYKEIWYNDDMTPNSVANGKMPAINSIPLYVTGKYKFNTNSDIKPYIKADFGYSFNRTKKSFDINIEDDTGSSSIKYSGLKAKSSLYAAVGVGVEYRNITADLSYVFTAAKIRMNDYDDESVPRETKTFKANNSAIRLTIGYKFSF